MVSNSPWSLLEPKPSRGRILAYFIVGMSLIAIFVLATQLEWRGTSEMHAAGEVIAGALAIMLGVALTARSTVRAEHKLLILGVGLVGVGVLDLAHAALSEIAHNSGSGFEPTQIEPLSWLASRTLLATIMLVSALSIRNGWTPTRIRLVFAVATTVAVLAAYELVGPTPSFMFDQFAIRQPYELVPGVIFVAALVAYLRYGSSDPHSLDSWIIYSIGLGCATQLVFMPLSTELHDSFFAGAHMLKLGSYLSLMIGLLIDSHKSFVAQLSFAQQLGSTNEAVNRANLDLQSRTNDWQTIARIARLTRSMQHLRDNFDDLASSLSKRVRVDRLAVVQLDPTGNEAKIVAQWGVEIPGRIDGGSLPLSGTITGEILRGRRPLVIDSTNVDRFVNDDPRLFDDLQAGFRSWANVPIIAEDRTRGALLARSNMDGAYGEREIALLVQVAALMWAPLSAEDVGEYMHRHDQAI